MPRYAHLLVEIKCPSCNAVVKDMLWFQWGNCPSGVPRQEYLYHLNDSIRWQACQDGRISPWTFFNNTVDANIGDPAFQDLIIKDTGPFFQQKVSCKSYSNEINGAVIEIASGRIRNARVYLAGEFDRDVTFYTIEGDGLLKPRPDWNDHRMGLKPDC